MLKGDDISVFKEYDVLPKASVEFDSRIYFQGKCESVDEGNIYFVGFVTDCHEMQEINSIKIDVNDMILFSISDNQVNYDLL